MSGLRLSDLNKETTYLLTYLLSHWPALYSFQIFHNWVRVRVRVRVVLIVRGLTLL